MSGGSRDRVQGAAPDGWASLEDDLGSQLATGSGQVGDGRAQGAPGRSPAFLRSVCVLGEPREGSFKGAASIDLTF